MMIDIATALPDPAALSNFPGLNPTKDKSWGNEAFYLFPNMVIHLAANGWWCTEYTPLTIDKTLWQSTFYYRTPATIAQEFSINYFAALQRDIFSEDNAGLARQYQAVKSGAKSLVHFGKQEPLCRHMAAVWQAIAATARQS
jgi:hypothetical protein